MNIMALDLGTKTGWALVNRAGKIVGGTSQFHASTDRPEQRWMRFREFLGETRDAFGDISVCYFEEVKFHAGIRDAHCYGAFVAFLQVWAASNGVRLVPVNVSTIKREWTGKGDADKVRMIEVARAKGFKPVDDNHADALAILAYALKNEEVTA